MKLKLLYSYEEWLEKNKNLKTGEDKLDLGLSEKVVRGLDLAIKSFHWLSDEEREELDRIKEEYTEERLNMNYTFLYWKIVDMCLNPKGCKPDFKEIGKKQCELVRMIYPIVVPRKDESDDKI